MSNGAEVKEGSKEDVLREVQGDGGDRFLSSSDRDGSPRSDTFTLPDESPPSPRSSPSGPRKFERALRKRNRGHSLRRTLFAKTIQTSPREKRDAIELTAPGKHGGGNNVKLRSTSTEDLLESSRRTFASEGSKIWHYGKAFFNQVRKTILRIPEVRASADGRHIHINRPNPVDERTQAPYMNNSIRSSRYSLISFFPRQLFAQFSKLANAYFLIISIMQMIPGLSTTGQFTTIVPLLVFVAFSMGKEGWDDLRRWKLDKEENNHAVLVLDPAGSERSSVSVNGHVPSTKTLPWITKKWSEVKVGDVVRLQRNDQVPADMILAFAEGGTAYMETMALDGETNLKNKQPPVPLLRNCKDLDDISYCQGEIVVEDPSMDLYRFEGKITIGDMSFPLTPSEVLHRGSTLRNTPIVAGIVCYTGEECRIRQNANKNPRIKAPALQSLVNKIVILIALFVLVLSLGCSFGYSIWDDFEIRAWYLFRAGVPWGQILASFIIMFNTLLPLSLYVSMEIIKLIQIMLMNDDIDMYDEGSDTPMQCQTSTINEELGQVSYIFSDKTGTLTKNEMKVKKLSCAGYVWNHENDTDGSTLGDNLSETDRESEGQPRAIPQQEQAGKPYRQSNELSNSRVRNSVQGQSDDEAFPNRRIGDDISAPARSTESTRRLVEYIYRNPHAPLARKARFFLLSIALCHTCVSEKTEQSDNVQYQAASPDELALVTAAQEMGYIFLDRQSSTVTIKIFWEGENANSIFETYEVLHVIEFTSGRKRMSVVVREPDGRICVHCKGADTMICSLLRLSDLAAKHTKMIGDETDERKSLGANEWLRRQSTASMGRNSFGIVETGRRSSTLQRDRSVRRSVDQWLAGREDEAVPSANSPISARSPLSPHAPFQFPFQHPATDTVDVQQGSVEKAETSSLTADVKGIANDSLISNETWVMEQTLRHVDDFANQGLRTLLHAARYLDEEEYMNWAAAYREATTSLSGREARICEVANLIEKNFELTGATAIEDKLQDGVPDTIDRLRRANIKLWMLTGDKRETAISISRSCKLAKDYSTFVILDHVAGFVEDRMANALVDLSRGTIAHCVVVVDGETLASIEGNKAQRATFLDLVILVDSVICCRASPSQKAMLVRSIRRRVNGAVTLAIGDGANDVAMIQEADVGIGISGGKEGLQAARTSDYAIAQFRFLSKLLLVHGRYNYDRTSKYISGTTYKEMIFYLTQALYQRSNGYTGTSLYESWSLSWYNTFFTSLPIIFLGAFMADLSPATLLAVPELYTKGQRNGGFNFKIWLWWTFMATAEGTMVYYVMYSIYARINFTLDNGLYAMGVLTYSACVVIVNLKLQVVEFHNKTILTVVALIGSTGAWFVWNLLISGLYENTVIYDVKDGLLERFGRNALWWLTLIVTVLSFLLFEMAIKSLKATFFPSDVDLFQVFEKDPILRRRFEQSAAPLHHHVKKRLDQPVSVGDKVKPTSDAEREAEVEEILQNRASDEQAALAESPTPAKPSDIHTSTQRSFDVFSKGFGPIRRKQTH